VACCPAALLAAEEVLTDRQQSEPSPGRLMTAEDSAAAPTADPVWSLAAGRPLLPRPAMALADIARLAAAAETVLLCRNGTDGPARSGKASGLHQ